MPTIPLSQLIREVLYMRIAAELDLSISLHHAPHRSEGPQQPIIARNHLMRSGMVDQPGCRVIKAFKVIDHLPALIRAPKINTPPPRYRRQITAYPFALLPSIRGTGCQPFSHGVPAETQGHRLADDFHFQPIRSPWLKIDDRHAPRQLIAC
ncbi:MAG: hypothetical protein WAS26_18265 [Paracoccaceae bacterium]